MHLQPPHKFKFNSTNFRLQSQPLKQFTFGLTKQNNEKMNNNPSINTFRPLTTAVGSDVFRGSFVIKLFNFIHDFTVYLPCAFALKASSLTGSLSVLFIFFRGSCVISVPSRTQKLFDLICDEEGFCIQSMLTRSNSVACLEFWI